MITFKNLFHLRAAVIEAVQDSQRRRKAEFMETQLKEQFADLDRRLTALEALVAEILENSRQHREAFQKRQEQRQTKAVIREVTSNFFNN